MKSKKDQTKPDAPAATSSPQWLLEETETLQEMIEWWKSRESASMDAAGRRPLFIGETKNTGVRINKVILERAIEKSKRERAKTGGNLSQLMEWLLWIYIGSPDDVVEDPHPPK
ncbi:MAG: hypothetical protein HY912_18960 [Desulfomonile tiedjei]|uniref:Uncharacterized protein n=1 Tax=Desulfomonile tiedjei TaxID=2358 RepID=A0A9D6V7W6_9BACT|nr:hypothetical protein [Desulfomonile tiedjei]